MSAPANATAAIVAETRRIWSARYAQRMSLDPTVLAILSIFGGAALTALAGLVGAGINARREHGRWVRERRLLAYESAHKLVEDVRQWENDFRGVENFRRELDEKADKAGLSKEARAELVATGLNARNSDRFTPAASYAWTREIVARKTDTLASITLLGTQEVVERFDAVFGPIGNNDPQAYQRARRDMEQAMRRALKIKI